MSVDLTSLNGAICTGISNGTWLAIVAVGSAFEPGKIKPWAYHHDPGQKWTPEQLTIMADRIDQIAKITPSLRELAAQGGCELS